MIQRPFRLLALLLLSLASTRVDAQGGGLVLRACTLPGVAGEARCGTLRVPENRDLPGGRMLDLNVVVLPAHSGERAPDAVTFLSGGPGQAATPMASWLNAQFGALRDTRDIVLMDGRGTGASAPLNCEMRDPADPRALAGDFLPVEAVRRCRERLSGQADLARYTLPEFARDLDDVRAALGYERLNLHGTSFGTRAAQVYLRMYPDRVRSVVLHGVVLPGAATPQAHARDAEAALAGTVRDCMADPACAAAFPRLEDEVRTVAARVRRGPVEVSYVDAETGRVTLSLSRGTVAETVRKMLYAPGTASRLPFVIHRAAGGDWTPLASAAVSDRRMMSDAGWGLFLSVTCTEDVPYLDTLAARATESTTLLGAYRVRQQVDACRGWPRGELPAGYRDPVRSAVPALILAGEMDPATPPHWADSAVAGLPNAVRIVVPRAAHAYHGMPGADCIDPLVVEFIRAGSARGLDTSCIARVRRPAWIVDEPRPVEVDSLSLARLTGVFVSAQPPLEMEIVQLRGGLRVTFSGGNPPMSLIPISATRFAIEGAPGVELSFMLHHGFMRGVTVTTPDRPPMHMSPRR
ncbi:alpha/beta hydrolase [Longimicrobium terrae]|uniref:Pimeloyl-ACP methyl ester carboxylesterase n=1 Tax=Longimicrobium terrae TaxID=1639882 RepID=A0A841GZ66_9BACT|nr:alpha/beta fold hydrolase [Longimicrobium terrae]MBB4636450.1 pimeloyl-ACP methyl ester carboxylesterase [Longimicrobium terrae]MBB6071026.1 pimeloyl-ACP methyl ester carboxylesterase [Longimicrobium terrae]NNC29047.1 alpha/beta fold hydrolase [Longimicrobium terrae]